MGSRLFNISTCIVLSLTLWDKSLILDETVMNNFLIYYASMKEAISRFWKGHSAENKVTSCLGLQEKRDVLLCEG